jgi:hypothetical protein
MTRLDLTGKNGRLQVCVYGKCESYCIKNSLDHSCFLSHECVDVPGKTRQAYCKKIE